jgi:prefoldin alpha subunit
MQNSNNQNEQKKQEGVILYQILQRRLQELLEQNSLLERKLMEIDTTKNGLEYLKKTGKSNEVMIPLGSGCFIYGSTENVKKVLINTGSNVIIEKGIGEALQFLKKQEEDVEKMGQDINKQINEIVKKMNEIALELQEQ